MYKGDRVDENYITYSSGSYACNHTGIIRVLRGWNCPHGAIGTPK